MSLSCDCGWGDYDWYFEVEDEERLAMTDYRCYGCGSQKNHGDHIRRIWSHEIDEDGEEFNYEIMGRICEECAGLYDSLLELGFCMTADVGFIKEAMNDYRENYVVKRPAGAQ